MGNEMSMPRREFLAAAGLGLSAASVGLGVEMLDRTVRGKSLDSFIKGLSLATYSLRPKMRWFKGKETKANLSMEDFLEYCAQQNFDAAELTAYFFEHPVTPQRLRTLKRKAHLLGLDISGGAIGNDFGHPPSSEKGKQELAYTRSWIDHYSELGAPAIRIFAGRSRPDGATDQDVIKNVQANLERILPHAERRGVMLGIENHDFAMNIDHLLAILEGINSDWLGVTWDTANIATTDDPYRELARIAPFAITAQLKMMIRVDDKPVPADYGRLVEILRSAKFRGYLVLEYEESKDAYEAIPAFMSAVQAAIN